MHYFRELPPFSQHAFCVDLRGLLEGLRFPVLVFTKGYLEASR